MTQMKIYPHYEIHIQCVRIVKRFLVLSIITLSVVVAGVRLAGSRNHWKDVAFGFRLGAVIAAYLMKNFRSSKSFNGTPVAKNANYDNYQSYEEDHTQYNKEMDATDTPGHSVVSPEQFSLQPSLSQGHLPGGFARHRYDLKTQTQHVRGHVSQQIPTDRMGAVIGRGEAADELRDNVLNAVQYVEFGIPSCHEGNNESIHIGQHLVPFLSSYMSRIHTLRLWRPDDFPWTSIRPHFKRAYLYASFIRDWKCSLETPESLAQHTTLFKQDLSQLIEQLKQLVFLDICGAICEEKVEAYRLMAETSFPNSQINVGTSRFRLWF